MRVAVKCQDGRKRKPNAFITKSYSYSGINLSIHRVLVVRALQSAAIAPKSKISGL
jgi:hypothetical protein